ncbi:hypothetical protein GCM10011491_39120 [Brucella endophytica]|uniref:Uncharacterized protein n=1 Tax=Brucella endophytica TaxID=1963359 RepID=A0A916SMT2_9HYPH|nr:hypothetical protein [Brucella endophytica]GGB07139.1 hypothetical protein GCM10011491_39120 [Brucella endophytica]
MTPESNTEAQLSSIIGLLRVLFKLVDREKSWLLAYMLSMAIIEAEDAYGKERPN